MAEFMLYLGILLNLLYLGLAITAIIYLIKIYKLPVVLVNLKNTIKSLKGLYCECLNKQEVSPNEPLTVYS
ncbi:hypothetical protein [Streptococcus agalactiae]|uniref:hypothetical protein n=1 Tax=Streptococcus agalactiae TaxID=1311 RepID=UPI0006402527|nr:hypothetical protein [Streptococcus agalactiae]KLK14737.1 hypothetical protein WB16_09370 [Streptococcus agalactiae]